VIEKTFTKASDDCLEIYKAITERDGGCETCAIFFQDNHLYSDPVGIGRALPNGANSNVVMELCTKIAQQLDAIAFVVTTNVRMLDESFLEDIDRQKEEDPDEEPDNPLELMDKFSDHVIKGIAQFLMFRWGATYQRFIVQGFEEEKEFKRWTGNFELKGWEAD